MSEGGIDNSTFELSEMAESEDTFSTNPMDDKSPVGYRGVSLKKKVFRHNTDVAAFASRMKDDVILEDDVITSARPPQSRSRSGKKTVLVSRHNTEVLQRRKTPTPCYTPTRDAAEIQVTRRSVSRQSSSVQSSNPIQVLEDPQAITRGIVRSSRLNKAKRKLLGSQIHNAHRRLKEHGRIVQTHQSTLNKRAIERAFNIIHEQRIVWISGRLGSGKSVTANILAQSLIDKYKDHKPIFLQELDDVDTIIDSGNSFVIIADDIFGDIFFKEARARQLSILAHKLLKMIQAKRHFIIVACETQMLAQAIHSLKQLQSPACLSINEDATRIDMHSTEFSCLHELSESIATSLNFHEDPNQNGHRELIVDNPDLTLGFPLLCALRRILGMNLEVFKSPLTSVVQHLNYIKNHLSTQFLSLTMTVVMNNRFSKEHLSETSNVLDDVCELLKLPRPSIEEVEEAANDLTGTFLARDSELGCLRYSSKFLYCTVLHTLLSFVKDQRAELLKILPIDVVSQVCSETISPCSVSVKLMHTEYTLVLYKMQSLLPVKDPGVFKSIAACRLWREETFCNLAIAVIGINIFFCEDTSACTLLVYMTEECKSELLIKIIDFLQTYRVNDLKEYQVCLSSVMSVALRLRLHSVVEALSNLVWRVDEKVVDAVVESGEISFFKTVLQNSIDTVKNQRQIVFLASKYGHVSIVKHLLDLADEESKYSLMRCKDGNGWSVVHFAAMADTPEALEFFINNGADAMAQTKDGETILHVAANYGNLDVLRFILDRFSTMKSYTNNYGFTPAHIAVREGYVDALKVLVDTSTENKVHGENTIIHIAAFNGRNDVLKYLCMVYPKLIDMKNSESFTAVQVAANMGFEDTFQLFIDIGIDVNSTTIDNRSFLHLAAFRGKVHMMKYLITRYQDLLDVVDLDGNTAAHDAAASGKVEALSVLKHGIDLRRKSSEGCSILHDACYYGKLDMVKYVINNFPDLKNAKTVKGYTPCHGAALGGFIDILTFLIDEGADFRAVSGDGSSILHEAAFAAQLEMVKYICSKFPGIIEQRNQKSYTANHFAAQEGHVEVFKYIILIGGDDESVTQEGQTFLQIAAYNGRMTVVKYICENIPKLLHRKDYNDAHAIHYAARGGHENVLMFLMAQGADASSQTENGSTMLHLAAFDGRLEMVAHLCNRVPSLIYKVDSAGHNAAHYAAGSGHLQLLVYLLGKGINPINVTSNGCTLILKAAFNGHMDVVSHLSENYPKMASISDSYGCNALHYAACSGDIGMFSFFTEQGLDPMSTTNDGHSVLHIAAYHAQLPLVKYLCAHYPDLRHMKDHSGRNPAGFAELSDDRRVQQFFKQDKQKVAMSDASTTCPCFCCCRSWTERKTERASIAATICSCLQQCCMGMVALVCRCRRK